MQYNFSCIEFGNMFETDQPSSVKKDIDNSELHLLLQVQHR